MGKSNNEHKAIHHGRPMHVIIQKPDLDTCLTGLILKVSEHDHIQLAKGGAPDILLKDPTVLCIEAGGSGDIANNNFDHHDPLRQLPAACQQAFALCNNSHAGMERLVQYVAMVDGCEPFIHQLTRGVYLSHLFFGLVQSISSPIHQFLAGIHFLREVLERELDPFGDMPIVDHWHGYYENWLQNKQIVAQNAQDIEWFSTKAGKLAGFLAHSAKGGFGYIYSAGGEIGILYNPMFGPEKIVKYTIGSSTGEIGHLIGAFSCYERGWGGRATIMGSPYRGSRLTPETVKQIVWKNC